MRRALLNLYSKTALQPNYLWRLTVPNSTFRTGDTVYDKHRHAWGQLQEIPDEIPMMKKKHLKKQLKKRSYEATFEDGLLQSVERKKLLPIYAADVGEWSPSSADSPTPVVVVTHDTDTYRLLAQSQIDPRAAKNTGVLEVGTSTGKCSEVLWKHPVTWMGIDSSGLMIEKVNRRIKYLREKDTICSTKERDCYILDPMKDPESGAALVRHHFRDCESVSVFLDIGGNRDEFAVSLVLQWILRTFATDSTCLLSSRRTQPLLHQIVVKSEFVFAALYELNARCDPHLGWIDANAWFVQHVQKALTMHARRRPLEAAHRFVPLFEDNNGEDDLLQYWEQRANVDPTSALPKICRYHNYHPDGCSHTAEACLHNHVVCHICLEAGHIARDCPCVEHTAVAEQTT